MVMALEVMAFTLVRVAQTVALIGSMASTTSATTSSTSSSNAARPALIPLVSKYHPEGLAALAITAQIASIVDGSRSDSRTRFWAFDLAIRFADSVVVGLILTSSVSASIKEVIEFWLVMSLLSISR